MKTKKEEKECYCDLHCHSNRSDGLESRLEVVRRAIGENPDATMILGISDHNMLFDDIEELQEKYREQIILVPACEISCTYFTSEGIKKEIHINAIDYETNNSEFANMLKKNQHDKRVYVEAILEKLEAIGIHVFDSYEELVNYVAPSKHVGRMAIARKMLEKKLVSSIDEAFDEYFGSYGKRTCFVENNFGFVSIEECIKTCLSAKAVPVLCHPYFYNLDEDELIKLIYSFAKNGGMALEAEYGAYSETQRKELREMALHFGLGISAGSDYHGNEDEHLHHKFPSIIFEQLMEKKQNL